MKIIIILISCILLLGCNNPKEYDYRIIKKICYNDTIYFIAQWQEAGYDKINCQQTYGWFFEDTAFYNTIQEANYIIKKLEIERDKKLIERERNKCYYK